MHRIGPTMLAKHLASHLHRDARKASTPDATTALCLVMHRILDAVKAASGSTHLVPLHRCMTRQQGSQPGRYRLASLCLSRKHPTPFHSSDCIWGKDSKTRNKLNQGVEKKKKRMMRRASIRLSCLGCNHKRNIIPSRAPGSTRMLALSRALDAVASTMHRLS